jgi:two-component system OmpR family response regulator
MAIHEQTGPRRPTPPPRTSPQSKIRVLVLEDDPDLSEVLATLLNLEGGFAMDICADVAGCLQHLRAASRPGKAAPYDVLLLDLHLPGGRSGTEVFEAAGADPNLCLPPVVVCTALAQSRVDAYTELFAAFDARIVHKPFDTDELLTALRVAAHRDAN